MLAVCGGLRPGEGAPLTGLVVRERPFTLEVRLTEGWLGGHRQRYSQYESLLFRRRMHDDDTHTSGHIVIVSVSVDLT